MMSTTHAKKATQTLTTAQRLAMIRESVLATVTANEGDTLAQVQEQRAFARQVSVPFLLVALIVSEGINYPGQFITPFDLAELLAWCQREHINPLRPFGTETERNLAEAAKMRVAQGEVGFSDLAVTPLVFEKGEG